MKRHTTKTNQDQVKPYASITKRKICDQLLPEVNVLHLCILNNLSTAYQVLGDSKKALQYHEQAIKVYGVQLYDAARSINKLGDGCYSSRDYKGSIMAYEQALKLYERLYGTNYPHSDIITTLTKLSKAHCFPGNGKEALTYARQAAKICESLNGKESSDFAEALYNLRTVHGYCGNYQVSTECREEALKIYEKLYVDRHSYIAITINN
jgi:tetratricopeptide (TPR) repeat protein